MNHIIKFSFAEWLSKQESIEEAVRLKTSPLRSRPEDLPRTDLVVQGIDTDDIVELGAETQYKGLPVKKYGKVIEVIGKQVFVEPLSGGKIIILSVNDLYPVDLSELIPQEAQTIERGLAKLGAKKLWLKRTQRQRLADLRRQAREAEEREAEIAKFSTPDTSKDFTRQDIAKMRRFLFGDTQPSKEPEISAQDLFGSESKKKTYDSPLARFRRSKSEDDLEF